MVIVVSNLIFFEDGSRRGLLKRGINLRRSFGLSSERDKKNKGLDLMCCCIFVYI